MISGRLSRLQADGDVMTGAEQVLVEDWCQQYPSHSVGALAFGADGALYVTGGDGASFNFTDYGQDGSPVNPCGDPPGAPGTAADASDRRGRRAAQPGPAHGRRSRRARRRACCASTRDTARRCRTTPTPPARDPNARRDRRVRPAQPVPHDGPAGHERGLARRRRLEHVGGDQPRRPGRARGQLRLAVLRGRRPPARLRRREPRPLRAPLHGRARARRAPRSSPTTTPPRWSPARAARRAARPSPASPSPRPPPPSRPPTTARCSSPTTRATASGRCARARTALPSPSTIETFAAGAANPVDLAFGPGGDLFYPDFDGGTIRRITYTAANQPPTAVARATPEDRPRAARGQLRRHGLHRPGGRQPQRTPGTSTATARTTTPIRPRRQRTYSVAGDVAASLRVSDAEGATATDTVTITVGNTPPTATIELPDTGDHMEASATRSPSAARPPTPQDGALPAASLSWKLLLQHCPSDCHDHPIQTWDRRRPQAPSPRPTTSTRPTSSCCLTATDSGGLSATQMVRLDPRTVDPHASPSSPGGLTLDRRTPPGESLVHAHASSSARDTRSPLRPSSGGGSGRCASPPGPTAERARTTSSRRRSTPPLRRATGSS